MLLNALSIGAYLTPLKRCAHWSVKSKINSAWKGFYLCGFGDKPSQIDGKGVIKHCVIPMLSHLYPQNPYFFTTPAAFSCRRRCSCCHWCSSTKPKSQPHKPGVYPDEIKQKTALKSIVQHDRGTDSTDPRVVQGNQREHTEYDCALCVTDRAVERPEELLPCLVGTQSTQAVANPENSAVPRDIAGCPSHQHF